MKIDRTGWFQIGVHRPLGRGGFTLTEMMVAVAVFVMAIGALLLSHIFGLRLFELAKAKMGASDEVRTSLSYLLDEVRSNDMVLVGSGNANGFVSRGDGEFQTGNALQLYPTNDTNSPRWVRYYMDTNAMQLMRLRSSDTNARIIVHSVTNVNVFTAEDMSGTLLTNNNNNRVIGMFLVITQLYTPAIAIRTGGTFDYYQLRVKATRRQL